MIIPWEGQHLKTAVLIPTRGRADFVLKTWPKKMAFLNDEDVILGMEVKEFHQYEPLLKIFPKMSFILYDNSRGSVAVAREHLRKTVTESKSYVNRGYDWFVVTDDNAIYTQESLHNLVRTAASWEGKAIVAGMHNTAKHFDRKLIPHAITRRGLKSYTAISMMYQVYPQWLYKRYAYPPGAYGLDDRHLVLWAIQHGQLRRDDFRVAMSAPFTKSRYQAGGQGSIEARAEKNGRAIAQLACDFPKLVGMTGTLRLPWQLIFKSVDGDWAMDRLAGGAMRKEDQLHSRRVPIRKRKKHTSTT